MNEKIDLTKILKDCPKGTKFYSPISGEVDFKEICSDKEYPIVTKKGVYEYVFTEEGFYFDDVDVECLLFPSKDQRDWSKFTAPWYNKERFDPKTLQPFDKVVRRNKDGYCSTWSLDFFSHISYDKRLKCVTTYWTCVIPYNEETEDLVGTTDEAPEYYRYWEK